MQRRALNIYILRQRESTWASQSWSCSLLALPVTVKSGQDSQGAWCQALLGPQTTCEAGVSVTALWGSSLSQRQRHTGGSEPLLSSPQHACRLHSPVSPASILMVYFHVCLPHSTVNDFRTPPPLANLATFCKILRYPFLKTLACHLPEDCHNNKRNLEEREVNGTPWSCAVCNSSSWKVIY